MDVKIKNNMAAPILKAETDIKNGNLSGCILPKETYSAEIETNLPRWKSVPTHKAFTVEQSTDDILMVYAMI